LLVEDEVLGRKASDEDEADGMLSSSMKEEEAELERSSTLMKLMLLEEEILWEDRGCETR